MACLSAPLRFRVRRSKPQLIVPSTSTPHEQKPLSDIDDQASIRVHVPVLMFYRNSVERRGEDPAMAIKEGLAKALVFYYPLAGRIFEGDNGKLIVNCNGKGVFFVEAKANVKVEQLSDKSILQPPCPYLNQLLHTVPGSKGIIDSPLLLIQVTHFTCGGFALGIRFNHTMMDGQGFVQFVNAVSELAKGASVPSTLPNWERGLLTARPTPTITCEHNEFKDFDLSKTTRWWDLEKFLLTSKFINAQKLASDPCVCFSKHIVHSLLIKRSFTFGSRELQAIKDQCPSSTTFEALSACLWKCRTIALRPDPNSTMILTIAVNIRERLQDPKLPHGYYGNGIVSAAAVTTAKLLCSNPISYAAKLIREAKNAVNDDYVKSITDLLVTRGRPRANIIKNFLITDNSRFGYDEVDFGWGKPVYGGIYGVVYGVGILLPHKRMEDTKGKLVALALPPIIMGKFQNELRKMIRPQN